MKNIILLMVFSFIGFSISAQGFNVPLDAWSTKEDATITLKDGTEVVGIIKNLKRSKGLVKEVVVKTEKGKEKIVAADIQSMLIVPNKFETFGNKIDVSSVIRKKDGKVSDSNLYDGKVFYELQEVEFKKGSKMLLLQLLNPSFSDNIKVYHDPFARETASLGVKGIDVVGGDAATYYVKIEGKPAFKLKKKDYKDMLTELYGDCDVAGKLDKNKANWGDFPLHVFIHYNDCSN